MEQDSHRKLRVGIVADWSRRSRGLFWPAILEDLQSTLPTEVKVYRLADRILKQGTDSSDEGFFPEKCDVLIVNWDAINGDPDFGSNLALQWFEIRRPSIFTWVETGGILVIEGQAAYSVPIQKVYDTLLGPSELALSRAANEVRPLLQIERVGARCRMTSAARKSPNFAELSILSAENLQRKQNEMFPLSQGQSPVSAYLVHHPWDILYRGWFRWDPLARKRLPWVPIVETAGKKINHPTMLVAKHGRGAIFASTMLLASSGQRLLIEAILRTHNNTADLPSPARLSLRLRDYVIHDVLPILAGIGAGIIMAGNPNPIWSGVANWILLVVGAVLFWLIARIFSLIKLLVMEMIGL